MNTKQLIGGAAIAAVALTTLGGTVSAARDTGGYESDTSVPGQKGRSGQVANHYTQESGGCDYVVNTLGDFGGDPYLNDGHMMNRIICEDGSVWTYHIFHETHPAYKGTRTPIWGEWEYFITTNGKG